MITLSHFIWKIFSLLSSTLENWVVRFTVRRAENAVLRWGSWSWEWHSRFNSQCLTKATQNDVLVTWGDFTVLIGVRRQSRQGSTTSILTSDSGPVLCISLPQISLDEASAAPSSNQPASSPSPWSAENKLTLCTENMQDVNMEGTFAKGIAFNFKQYQITQTLNRCIKMISAQAHFFFDEIFSDPLLIWSDVVDIGKRVNNIFPSSKACCFSESRRV